jgi:hypothetical protein
MLIEYLSEAFHIVGLRNRHCLPCSFRQLKRPNQLTYTVPSLTDSFARTLCALIVFEDHTLTLDGDLYDWPTINLHKHDGDAKTPEFSFLNN